MSYILKNVVLHIDEEAKEVYIVISGEKTISIDYKQAKECIEKGE